MSCNGMPFFPGNFMVQAPNDEDGHNPAPPPHGKRSIDVWDEEEEESHAGEKKRRLSMEQVRTLEKSFALGNKVGPERKMQLARGLGLQPRQVSIWFQNRRARWKTKQLEKDYDFLKAQFEALKAENHALKAHNHKLHAQILALRSRESTESINLNKDSEGCCSNRSDNSFEMKLDISRTPAIDSPLITSDRQSQQQPISSRHMFTQFFPNPSSRPDDEHNSKSSMDQMFSGMDDQPAFWPWLDQNHHFN